MDRKRRRIINTIIVTTAILACITVIAISFEVRRRVEQEFSDPSTPDTSTTTPSTPPTEKPFTPPDTNEITEAKFIDLQPTVQTWLSTLTKQEDVGLMIYDLNNSRIAASYQADKIFSVASLYKLLFVYDGYNQIALGVDNGEQQYTNTSDKGSLTLYQCLDLTIRESYNGCADKLASNRTRISRVNNLIKELEMSNTSNIGLESTAADYTKLLRAYWRHTYFTQSLWERFTDSMLNQPIVNGTDWRQGLPAGFSSNVNVYNKVGWEWNGESWNIYADAAILDFIDQQHYYTMVVLTKNFRNSSKISQLGRMIEDAVIFQSEGVIK